MKTPLAWGLGAIALFGVLLVGVPDARANTPVQLDPAGHDVHSFEISLDGTTVVYRAESSPTPGIELFSVPVGGGPAVEIGAPFNLVTLPNYEITPDSTRVVYLEGTGCCGPFTLASVPIGGGAATPLFTESHTVSFQISPDSQHVVLTEHTLPVRLISVPITGGQPVELDSGAIGAFTISPDSTRVVYDKGGELRVAPLNGGAVRTLSQSVHAPDHFRITPDALTVVYRGLQPPTLLSVPITGGAPTRLSPVIEPAGPTDGVGSFELTEDGAWAVFEFDPGPGLARQIWAVPATGGAPRRVSPLPADPANQTSINFVIPPGSTTVLVEVDRALYAANLATGGAVELAPRVDSQALEGSATHGVYIDLDNNNELTSVPLSGGAGTQLTSTPFGVSFFSLSPGRTKILYPGSLATVAVTGGASTAIDAEGGTAQWSATGAHVVYMKGFGDLYSWADPAGGDAPGGPPDPPPGPGPGPGPGPTGTQVGLVDPSQGQWHLRDSDGDMTSFFFGNPGDVPVIGDWDCDGTDTPGLFRTSDAFAYLSNANRSQIADIRFFFGDPADLPLAGDFDGDGCDTLSIYRPGEGRFYIINELGENEGGLGAADFSFGFGDLGDKPVVGDWDGDGIDEIGLHRESTGLFYWRNTLTTGIADGSIIFGDPGDRFVAGDWGTVDGRETPGLFRPSATTFFFRHTLTQGNADDQFTFGEAPWLPVAGEFGL